MKLTRRLIRRDPGATPAYRQVYDLFLQAIVSGELRPGEELEPEGTMATLLGIDRAVLRKGLEPLFLEGLLSRQRGRRHWVPERPPVRRQEASRYIVEMQRLLNGQEPRTAFVEDHGITWEQYSVRPTYRQGEASTWEASKLDIEPETPVLRRHFVKYADGRPVQIQDSVIPLALIEDSPAGLQISDPSNQPWPGGTLAELWSLGLRVTKVVEEASVRLQPTAQERRELEMNETIPVWNVVRRFLVGLGDEQRPSELSIVVSTTPDEILVYETDLSHLSGVMAT